MNLKSLIDLIRQEQKIHEKVLLAKREEQRLIAVGDAALLLDNTQRLSDWIDQAASLEAQRRELVFALADELKLERENPTLRDLLAALPPENNAELESAGIHLRSLMEQVRQVNRINAGMLQRALETITGEIAGMVQSQESGVYTRSGVKERREAYRAGLNVRV